MSSYKTGTSASSSVSRSVDEDNDPDSDVSRHSTHKSDSIKIRKVAQPIDATTSPNLSGYTSSEASSSSASSVASASTTATKSRRGASAKHRKRRSKSQFTTRRARRQYLKWIAPELELVQSLEQQHADDLGVQLLGTFRLKRFLRSETSENFEEKRHGHGKEDGSADSEDASDPDWKAKEKQSKRGKSRSKTTQKSFPPLIWSAWPLPPELVPALDECFGAPAEDDDGLAEWTFCGPRAKNATGVLRELLAAIMLKKANGQLKEAKKLARDLTNYEVLNVERVSQIDIPDIMRLRMVADDDIAYELMEEKLDSIVEQFNRLMQAMQRTRKKYHYGSHNRTYSSDKQSGEDNHTDKKTKRRVSARKGSSSMPDRKSRPPKSPVKTVRGKASSKNGAGKRGAQRRKQGRSRSKSRAGRPLIYEKPREGESYYMMRKRVSVSRGRSTDAKKGCNLSDELSSLSPPLEPRSASQVPSKAFCSLDVANDSGDHHECLAKEKSVRTPPIRELRDWKDVLNIARKSGWSEDVVDRAAKRCDALFRGQEIDDEG